jgi:membrane-bound lytic murein transglycosylase B
MRVMILAIAIIFATPIWAQEGAGMTIGTQAGLATWVTDFRARALGAGISQATFDGAMQDVQFLPDVVEKDRNQNEFTRSIWDYLDRAVSEDRIVSGKKALKTHAAVLDQIEARYGVDRHIVVAIWGLESAYGAVRGDIATLSALATMAYEGRRAAFFEGELIALLQTLQEGKAKPQQLRGSWAGAMGHTQFMPSSYRALAVDFSGDGIPNIWDDDPTDALASTAAYLAASGWKSDIPWGVEVVLPADFDRELAGRRTQKPLSVWIEMGVTGDIPLTGWGAIITPAGARGPAFMIFDNFAAVETYNRADAYVIAVGHLADRLRGGGAIKHPWPRDLRALTVEERKLLQQRLLDRALYVGEADGRIGPLTIAAIKSFQRSLNLIPDGYASLEVLDLLQ